MTNWTLIPLNIQYVSTGISYFVYLLQNSNSFFYMKENQERKISVMIYFPSCKFTRCKCQRQSIFTIGDSCLSFCPKGQDLIKTNYSQY